MKLTHRNFFIIRYEYVKSDRISISSTIETRTIFVAFFSGGGIRMFVLYVPTYERSYWREAEVRMSTTVIQRVVFSNLKLSINHSSVYKIIKS